VYSVVVTVGDDAVVLVDVLFEDVVVIVFVLVIVDNTVEVAVEIGSVLVTVDTG
jgi:hypothetical protein